MLPPTPLHRGTVNAMMSAVFGNRAGEAEFRIVGKTHILRDSSLMRFAIVRPKSRM
jgi:hypothetical protein